MDLQAINNPALERLWIEEVRHLHALWHQGPPRNPNSENPKIPNPSLRASYSISLKKEKPKKRRGKKKQKKNTKQLDSDQNSDEKPKNPEIEWPCENLPEPQPESGWPASKTPAAVTRPASDEQQAKLVALNSQQKGMNACQDFFSKKKNSSGDEEEEEEEEEDLMDDEDGDNVESVIYEFLLGIFKEDAELRGYYERHCEGGEFFCLVCEGIKERIGKRYKNCVALVQHSTKISKTKNKEAHRAFGQVVCRIFGWDINRLPSIVLDSGQPLIQSLAKAESQDGSKEDNGEKDDAHNKVVDLVEADNSMQAGSIEDNAIGEKDDAHSKVVDLVEADNEGTIDCKAGSKEDDGIDEKNDAHNEVEGLVEADNEGTVD